MIFRLHPRNGRQLFLSEEKRSMKHIKDKSLPLKMFIHGFSEKAPGGEGSSSEEIRDGNELIKVSLQNNN